MVGFVPWFWKKTAASTANLFMTPGVCSCGRTDNAEELSYERYHLYHRANRRDCCGALVLRPALIGNWARGGRAASPAKPRTPHRVTTQTTTGSVIASSVPSTTAPETGFTSRRYCTAKDVRVCAGRHRREQHDDAGGDRRQVEQSRQHKRRYRHHRQLQRTHHRDAQLLALHREAGQVDAKRSVGATLLKASCVRGHRSSSVRNALSVASHGRSWTSKLGEKHREFLRASQDRSIR